VEHFAAAAKKVLRLPLPADTLGEKPWEKQFAKNASQKKAQGTRVDGGIVARAACSVKRKGYKILW
jgi:hypothetical protein